MEALNYRSEETMNYNSDRIHHFSTMKTEEQFNNETVNELEKMFKEARMKERIHIICPVRNVTEEQQRKIDDYCLQLVAEGYDVHNPKYAVDQTDETGFNICKGHLDSIKDKRTIRVDIFWDGTSKGSHFDLGMVFAIGKPVKIVKLYQDDIEGKSYVKVMNLMNGDYLKS